MKNGIVKMLMVLALAISILIITSHTALAADTIYVDGKSNTGITYTANSSGYYRITIISGAVSPFGDTNEPSDGGHWLAQLAIYKNRPVEWALQPDIFYNLVNIDYLLGNTPLGNTPYYSTQAMADENGRGLYVDVPLLAGDYINIISGDSRENYADNRGGITIDIQYTPFRPSFMPDANNSNLILTTNNSSALMSSDVFKPPVNNYKIEFYQVTNGNSSSNFYRQYCTLSLTNATYEGQPALHWIKTVFFKPLLSNGSQDSIDESATIFIVVMDAYVDYDGNVLNGEMKLGPGNMPVYNSNVINDLYLKEQDPVLSGLHYKRELLFLGIENTTILSGTFECNKYLLNYSNGSDYYRFYYWIPQGETLPVKLSLYVDRPNDLEYHEGWVTQAPLVIKKPENVVPPIIAGISIGALGSIITKLIGFLLDGIKSLNQKSLSDIEIKMFDIRARDEKPSLVFGISSMEILVGAFAAIALGLAALYTNIFGGLLSLSIENIFLFIVAAALTVILHELSHILVAYLFKTNTEMRFWGIGTLALIVTTLVFGFVFGQPMRTLINKDDTLGKRKVGLISLAGPIASFLTNILFILMMVQGGFLAQLGIRGLTISIVLSVYSLLPFKPMEGRDIWNWSIPVWVITFFPILIVCITILIFVIP